MVVVVVLLSVVVKRFITLEDIVPDKNVERTPYDLSHWSMNVGNIGQLQTMSIIPVVAGDSIKIDLKSVFRLSPLRRNMYLDCIVDMFAFYVPHRHVYGADWVSFLQDGEDEGVTLTTRTLTGNMECCGAHVAAGDVVPLWLTQGYINIWNRYFKDPSEADRAANFFDARATNDPINLYGFTCGWPKRVWNATVTAGTVAADWRFPLVDTDKIDLLDMATTKGKLKTERKREFFTRRYADTMRDTWGSHINIDADQRPELIMRKTDWLSGYDVDGTSGSEFGSYTGKGASVGSMFVPPKFIPEHGVIWIMCLLRFPPVHTNEQHYLVFKTQPTYADIAGDPDIIARRAPIALNLQTYIKGSPVTDAGLIPFGQWYREQPNRVHLKYSDIEGHPFIEDEFSTAAKIHYIDPDEYENVFQSLQLRHWQSQGYINCTVKRTVPGPLTSIFAGVS